MDIYTLIWSLPSPSQVVINDRINFALRLFIFCLSLFYVLFCNLHILVVGKKV